MTTKSEAAFMPRWRIKQAFGDYVPNLEWRFRGPRFAMDWRQASGHQLERTAITAQFDLSKQPAREDDLVGVDEIGLEVRFAWRGAEDHELHRWPITRKSTPQKIQWEVGHEVLPPLRWDA